MSEKTGFLEDLLSENNKALKQANAILERVVHKLERASVETGPTIENPLNIDEVVVLTGFSKPTLYSYCQKNEVPFCKKNGRLFFFRSEIIDWLKKGRVKTLQEIKSDVENTLNKKRHG